MNYYSISICYMKKNDVGFDVSLRVILTKAESKEDAETKAEGEFKDEMKDYQIHLIVTLKVNQ